VKFQQTQDFFPWLQYLFIDYINNVSNGVASILKHELLVNEAETML